MLLRIPMKLQLLKVILSFLVKSPSYLTFSWMESWWKRFNRNIQFKESSLRAIRENWQQSTPLHPEGVIQEPLPLLSQPIMEFFLINSILIYRFPTRCLFKRRWFGPHSFRHLKDNWEGRIVPHFLFRTYMIGGLLSHSSMYNLSIIQMTNN